MQDWTPEDRIRGARRRDRAARAVAAAGVAATAGAVAATLGLASALSPPPTGPLPAGTVSAVPSPVPSDEGPAAAVTPEEQGSLALQGPDSAPRERSSRPARVDVPRTSGS